MACNLLSFGEVEVGLKLSSGGTFGNRFKPLVALPMCRREAWKQLLLERFLARLANSDQQEKFIFKGGLLLAQYLTIGRETTDADFLITKIKGEARAIEAALKEVIVTNVEDGFSFSWSAIEELEQPHMDYPGFRASLSVNFEKMRDKIQIDIGVGDSVEAIEENFQPCLYKGKPIFAGEISLLVYPIETIFAEKLETIISRGAINSRMKDYHDVILMIREPNLLNVKKLRTAVAATFANRGTTLQAPIRFDTSGVAILQGLWGRHLNGLGVFRERLRLPDQMKDALAEINAWLVIHLEPMVEIPAREKWLFDRKDALAGVKRGLEQSAKGEAKSRGSFAKYADDGDEDE